MSVLLKSKQKAPDGQMSELGLFYSLLEVEQEGQADTDRRVL